MKHYYALVSGYGFISIWSKYGQPTLHVFNSKKERDNFVWNNDVLNGNINHRCWKCKISDVKSAYFYKYDGCTYDKGNVKYH